MIKENQKLFNQINVISDAAVAIISVIMSYLIVFNLLDFDKNYPLTDYIKLAVVFIPIQLITFGCLGLYDSFRTSTFGKELWKICQAFLVDGVLIIAMLYIVKIINFSRFALAIFLLLDLLFVALKRFVLRRSLKHFRKSGYNKKHVVIIGGGETASHYLETIRRETHMGFECAGYIADSETMDAKHLGGYDKIFDILDENSFSECVCALDANETDHIAEAVEACEQTGTKISVIPSIYKYMTTSPSIDVVGDIPMLNIRRIPLDNIGNAFMKRAMDIIGALVMIILTSPIMLVSALIIKLTMGGKVIFKQARVGLNKKIFTMYKLKSMRDNDESDTAWSTDSDPRKTRFGAFIRKFSIDELPQFFNVLKGDMSLVGPRPEIPFYVNNFKQNIPMYMIKHQVKPGITGLAQIRGFRGDTSIEKRIECDIEYIENWNIFLDVSILFGTLFKIVNKEKLETDEKTEYRRQKKNQKYMERHSMNTNKQKTDIMAMAIFLPAVLALGLIPILMQVRAMVIDPATRALFGGTYSEKLTEYALPDIYSQCKAFAIVIFALIMLGVAAVCSMFLFRRIEKRSLVYVGASVVYVIMALASTLGSDYQNIALYGVYDRAEGFFTTACYFVMFLFTMYTFRKTQNFSYVVMALMFCTAINVILGLFQYTGNNILGFDWAQELLIAGDSKDVININENKIIPGRMYGALYHYNYVGSFTGMVIPLFATLAIGAKKIWQKLVCAAFALIALFMLLVSSARSGIVAVAAAVLVGLIVFARVLIRRWKITVSVVAAGAVLVVGANFAMDNALFKRIPSLVSDVVDFIAPAEQTDLFSTLPVKDIRHNSDGSVSLVSQTDTLTLKYDKDNELFLCFDSAGELLGYEDMGYINISDDDDDFEDIVLRIYSTYGNPIVGDTVYMYFGDNESTWMEFRLFNDKQLHLVNHLTGERKEFRNADAIGFEGKELLGSSRGYIWSRTIPMLSDCLITGYGPDTFAYVFPQNDALAKYYAYAEGFNITVDKPHNLYLQIFVSNGLIALIAFLAICIFYLVDCFRLYALKKEYRIEQIYGISVMLAVVGYLAAGIFNDSVVSVAPVFWILLGVGAALNTINRRMDKNESTDVDEEPISEAVTPVLSESENKEYEQRGAELAEKLRTAPKKPESKPYTQDDLQNLLTSIRQMRGTDSDSNSENDTK